MEEELISIIIPNYNHASYLVKRIDSVLNQTYKNIEVILLDDCSTDNSKDIILQYRNHPKIAHIVFNQYNSGSVFKQWNRGISMAKGKYIWIAESDDWAENNMLGTLVECFKNEDLSFAYSNSNIVDDMGNSTGITLSDRRNGGINGKRWTADFEADGNLFLKNILSYGCDVNNASCVLFDAEKLKRVSPLIQGYRYAGDWACYIELCKLGNVAYRHIILSNYRDHANNASKSGYRNNEIDTENFKIISACYNWLKINKCDTKKYVYKLKVQILGPIIKSGKKALFRKFYEINKKLMFKVLMYFPIVFIIVRMTEHKYQDDSYIR